MYGRVGTARFFLLEIKKIVLIAFISFIETNTVLYVRNNIIDVT